MPRVLFWAELFWPYLGGIEILSAGLLPALQEHGYELAVVTSHGDVDLPNEAEYNGIPVFRFPFRSSLAAPGGSEVFELRRKVARLKKTMQPDLFHVNSIGPSVLFHLQTINAHEAPTLMTLHNEVLKENRPGPDTLMGRLLRTADWTTCVSAEVLAQFREAVPGLSRRSSLIYNGVKLPPVLPAPAPFDPPRLLCLGRLVHQKGFDLALTALARLSERLPDVRMTVAGDGPVRPQLQRQAVQLGLDDRVEFIGVVDPRSVPDLINTATVVVMPSRREGLPLVAIQAALMARPVVAARVGGLPEVVVDCQTGLLFPPEDSQALADKVALLLEQPQTATNMGEAARRRAQELFSWERCVAAYNALYKNLIAGAVPEFP